jgi:pimeloyl-ACP methyl ester carboxylesterase
MSYLEREQGKLFYFERGTEGPPLLFIHGAGGAHSNWLSLIKQLQPRRCLTLDLPGHGLSAGDGHDTIENYAAVVKQFIAGFLSGTKGVLLGHSMGGLVASCFASQNPDLTAGLILVASGFTSPGPVPTKIPTKEEICRFLYADEELVKKCLTQRLFMLDRPAVLLKDLQAAARFDYSRHPVTAEIPALVIAAEKDSRVSHESSQTAARFLNAKLEIIASSGHMPMVEKPAPTAETISSFLSSDLA